MELGQAQGPGPAAYTPHGGFAGQDGGRGNAGGSPGLRTCHYCHQPSHFMLSCPKLKHDMGVREAGRGCTNQAAGMPPDSNSIDPAGALEQGNRVK